LDDSVCRAEDAAPIAKKIAAASTPRPLKKGGNASP
jgi:hypothetical protein